METRKVKYANRVKNDHSFRYEYEHHTEFSGEGTFEGYGIKDGNTVGIIKMKDGSLKLMDVHLFRFIEENTQQING